MAVPKQHRSKSRQGQRRMHLVLEPPNLVLCEKCGLAKLPHIVCPECGFWRGRQVIDVLAKLNKKERQKIEKRTKEKQKDQNYKETPSDLNIKS